MNLVIVESPTKAKTISKFLGSDFEVDSSYGHVRDLPKSKLGIDLENNFEPQYIIPLKARKVVSELKKKAVASETVILATDGDREGEAIAWHLIRALGLAEDKTQRIVFHEITKSAIAEALGHPRSTDLNLVNAQQGRRVLDRLVGYKLSPFLWAKVASGLSAGRVQSVAVRLIVEREEEIQKFQPQEYWDLGAIFQSLDGRQMEAVLSKKDGQSLEKMALGSRPQVEEIMAELQSKTFRVLSVERKETKKNPPPPFITSTLQQSAATRLGFSAKKTMLMAQRLYEKGLITYMRTDSVNLSQESLAAAKQWLEQNLGAQYSSDVPRVYKTKSRVAQEAHEAIRPTDLTIGSTDPSLTDASEKKLYDLIWSRFLASQMPPAQLESTQVEAESGRYVFSVSGSLLKFDGFLKIWKQKFTEKEIPPFSEGESLALQEFLPRQHFTEPLPRYNEASLIKSLEEFSIGRPSTYAPIISVIQDRNYVEKKEGRFHPTEMGILVNRVLKEHFPQIVDIGFTANMEEKLDAIARGEENWQDAIREFYQPFSENLEKKYQEISKKDLVAPETTKEVCEKCGRPMVVKFSRYGKFLACTGFPGCKNTKSLAAEAPKKIGLVCPKCSVDSQRQSQPGEVIERRVSRGRARGKIFWGCSRYPECDYASWTNPLNPPPADKF